MVCGGGARGHGLSSSKTRSALLLVLEVRQPPLVGACDALLEMLTRLPFPSFVGTVPQQVRAIALERNELEALLFDMRSAPAKKHGELLDK